MSLFGSRVAQVVLEQAKRRHSKKHPERQPSIPQEAVLSSVLRAGAGRAASAACCARDTGSSGPITAANDFLGSRVVSDDGKVHLAPPAMLLQARKLGADFQTEKEHADGLKLITKRAVTTHNSWTHNIEEFVAADRSTNYLYVHPDDARRLGLRDGDLADVESATATVRVPVKLLAELMPGTVALPHGWGHQHAKGLSVAGKTTGVNVNLLAADGPDKLERVSGMAHLTGIPVDVRPAAGPLAGDDWSGITHH